MRVRKFEYRFATGGFRWETFAAKPLAAAARLVSCVDSEWWGALTTLGAGAAQEGGVEAGGEGVTGAVGRCWRDVAMGDVLRAAMAEGMALAAKSEWWERKYVETVVAPITPEELEAIMAQNGLPGCSAHATAGQQSLAGGVGGSGSEL